MVKKKTPWTVFIAIALAVLAGSWSGTDGSLLGITFYACYDFFGTLFLNALMLIVVPLVSSSIITGVARIGNDEDFGRLGIKMFSFYIGTTLLAVLIGLLFVNIFNPGSHISETHIAANSLSPSELHLNAKDLSFAEVLLEIVPSNVLAAFSQGQMLGLIFFSLLFGYAISKIESHPSSILLGFWQGIFQAMIKITHLIMKLLPFGVFCLVAKTFATTGIGGIGPIALFLVTVLLGLAVFMFIGLSLFLKIIGKVDPINHFRAMGPALITAFSTSSSSATLPVTINCVEKRAGVSNRICSLVIPLGTSMNMSGSALYECVAALFVAQAYGIDMSIGKQILVVLLALITSMGVAGVPAASLVAVIIILKAIGLPPEGIGLFIAVDRLLDMCRTTVNVFSDSVCAVLVARSEGEQVLTKRRFEEI